MRTFLFSAALLCCAFSCGGNKETTKKPQETFSLPSDFFLAYERTVCYGRCPAYRVEVNAKGEVAYEGKRFVKRIGKYQGMLNAQQKKWLYETLEKVQWENFRGEYDDKGISDLPSTYLTYQANGKHYKFHLRVGIPQPLRQLSDSLHQFFMNLELKPVEQ